LDAETIKYLEIFLSPGNMPNEEEKEPAETFVGNVLLDSPQRGNDKDKDGAELRTFFDKIKFLVKIII
jgi:hypothetical protein